MRQAGRYLPEYRELRARTKGFLDLCFTPYLAAEVTLQPLRRFDMDAAIVFSDILVVPHGMGREVKFVAGEGPKLTPLRIPDDVNALKTSLREPLAPIAETLRLVRKDLPAGKALIGFCGAPWTVACYMVEGGGSRDYASVRRFALQERETFALLVDRLVEASVDYLCLQIEAGADVIQIFDSWAGVLSEEEYRRWVIEPTRRLVIALKSRHPDVPVIGFARGSGANLGVYASETQLQAVSVDERTPLDWAFAQTGLPVQGNLDPLLLAFDREGTLAEARRILSLAADRAFIFNLGHGVVPETPPEAVGALCDLLRAGRS